MALIDTAPTQAPADRTDRRPWLALGLAALSATSYLLVLVVPWYAAGAPAAESLYLYEIGEQWPYTSPLAPVTGVLAFWALGIAPFASVGVAGWAAHRLWDTRTVPGGRAVVWAALVLSVVTLAWFATGGAGLLAWLID